MKKLQWKSKEQFEEGSPTLDKVSVEGEGDDARLMLDVLGSGNEDVPFTTPANYTYDDTKVNISDGKAVLKPQSGAIDNGNFPYTTPANYNYDVDKIEVTGGKTSLNNAEISDTHNWIYTDIGNYTISPIDSIDIVAGKAKLHDKGSTTQNDNVDYNTPANYTYDPAKIESIDKGGGNKAFRLKGGAGVSVYAQWHLNEIEGSDVSDSSGNGRDGVCQNMEDGDWVAGKLNNCLRINEGTADEYVDCDDIAGFERDEPFSIEFWSYNYNYDRNMCFVTKASRTGALPGWSIYMYNQGKLSFHLVNNWGGGNYIWVKTNITIWDPAWHHIIVTYDGSSTAAGIHIYVDSVDVALTVNHDNLSDSIHNTATCQIGGFDGQLQYKGRMDEVVIYDQELTQEDVNYRYNAGDGTEDIPGGFDTSDPTVVSDFDSAFGTILQWKDFVEAGDTPSGTELQYNISIDSSITWLYWNGASWVAADGTYAKSNTAVVMDTNLPTLGLGNSHFRIKTFLHTDGTNTPELDNTLVIWYEKLVEFETDGRITTDIEIDQTPDPLHSWDAFVETIVEPANTEIKYSLSNDSGTTWLYWSEAAWVAGDGTSWANFSTGSDVTTNFSSFPKTNAKLKLRAYLKTTDTTNSPELNNIAVEYSYGYSYATDDPDIKALFNLVPTDLESWDKFIETATKPTNTEIKYVLSNDDGVTWYYWNGAAWVSSDMQYTHTNTATEVNTNISSFPTSEKKLRISAFLHSSDSTVKPDLDNIYIEWTETAPTYTLVPQEISMNADLQPLLTLVYLTTTETVTKPSNTNIKYQYSINSGSSYNGTWLTEPELEEILQGITCVKDGSDKIRFKFQLSTTDDTKTPEIDNLNYSYASSFELEGSYTSVIVQPRGASSGQFITLDILKYDLTTPSGTTATLSFRFASSALDPVYPYTEYSNNQNLGIESNYIIWKIEMTGNGTNTPILDYIELDYIVGIILPDKRIFTLLCLPEDHCYQRNTWNGAEYTGTIVEVYDTKANAQLHNGVTGLTKKYTVTATLDENNRPTSYLSVLDE